MKEPLAKELALLAVRKEIVASSQLKSLTMIGGDENKANVLIPGDFRIDMPEQKA